MKLESQVCSLELAKRLKELGVKQESIFYWGKPHNDYFYKDASKKFNTEYNLYFREDRFPSIDIDGDDTSLSQGSCGCCEDTVFKCEYYSAFTVAELGELLPERIDQFRQLYIKLQKIKFNATNDCHYLCSFAEDGGYNADFIEYDCSDKNESNARAKMLIYLIEQGHVKV